MKLLKCTFRSPLNGSIYCEELLSDTDGRVELNSEQTATLYHRNYELKEFLENNKEDLTFAIPEGLSSCIIKAEFGDYTMHEGNLYLLTHVWVDDKELSEGARLKIQEWITGQLSDGWGESLEQREWMTKRVEVRHPYFDAYSLSFEEDEDYHEVSYYVNPWVSHEFYVELVDFCEDEIDVEGKIVASIELPELSKKVFKLPNRTAVRMFVSDIWGQERAEQVIEDVSRYSNIYSDAYYLLRQDTHNGCQLVPAWIATKGPFCAIYEPYKESEDSGYTGTQMSLEKAIIELLK